MGQGTKDNHLMLSFFRQVSEIMTVSAGARTWEIETEEYRISELLFRIAYSVINMSHIPAEMSPCSVSFRLVDDYYLQIRYASCVNFLIVSSNFP